jgi:hypothetical protein
MLFRPEEIHGTSGKRGIFEPFPERNGYIPHGAFRLYVQQLTIPDLHPDG